MKINLLVRFKNPAFWLGFIPAVTTFVYTILSLFEIVPPISQEQIINVSSVIISFLSTVGVLVDPTVEGLSDSERALKYTKPNSNANY